MEAQQCVELTCTNWPCGLTTIDRAITLEDSGYETQYAKESSGPNRTHDSGDYGEGDPPVPIPNTAVKPFSADGTASFSTWESRTSPDPLRKGPLARVGLFFCASREVPLSARSPGTTLGPELYGNRRASTRWALDATHVFCGRDGLVSPDGGHRLLGQEHRAWAGGCRRPLSRRSRLRRSRTDCVAARSTALERARAAIGQRPRVRREATRGDRASLRARPGVRYAYTPAERHDRALLRDAEDGAPLAAPIPGPRPRLR